MDATISKLWPTPLWIGRLEPTAETQQLAKLTTAEPQDVTHLRTTLAIMAALEAAASCVSDSDGAPLTWVHNVERWHPAHHVGYSYSPAAIRILAVLDSTPPQQHQQSGEIRLHDPRAGAANVALPGLPWGRPVTIQAITGEVIATPGWLPMSVAPVRTGHTVTVWTALGRHTTTPISRS